MSTFEEHNAQEGMAGNEAKFTVIISTYNYAHLLPDALRTLGAQTLPDFELLIVDDGSTDHTGEVVQQYSPQFRNCVYLKKPHTGVADSRNAGVRKATGTHLAFLDADDLWSPEYLEVVRATFASSPQAEIVFSNGLRILGSGQILRPVFPSHVPPLKGPINSVTDLFSVCDYFMPSGMVCLKSLFQRIGPFDTRFSHGDDVDWVIRAAVAGAYCVRIDQKLFLYRFHGDNLTKDAIAFLETWLKIYEERLKNSRLGPDCERKARHFAQHYVLRLLGICPPAKGRTLLARALETLPDDIILRCAYLSTYLGSTYVLKALKWGKHLIGNRQPKTRRIDLTVSPEIMFQDIRSSANP